MCTAIAMQMPFGETYFGRTMDFSFPLNPELYLVPRGYVWRNLLNTHKIKNRFSFIGMGQDLPPVIFADGVNEMGFAIAVLYFPEHAFYDPANTHDPGKPPIAAIELIHFLLGMCSSVEQACSILKSIQIVGVKDSVTNSIAPLHWIFADQGGRCMVAEKTEEGLFLQNNPIGVLSNSPDFSWHMTNLRNYMNVTSNQRKEEEWGSVNLTPFGQGAGSLGLPGDFTPPSRFVRASYEKTHVLPPANRKEAVITCFHILESVTIPKGVVMTAKGEPDYTQYTGLMNLTEKEYFYKTYENSQIVSTKLKPEMFYGSGITSFGKLAKPLV